MSSKEKIAIIHNNNKKKHLKNIIYNFTIYSRQHNIKYHVLHSNKFGQIYLSKIYLYCYKCNAYIRSSLRIKPKKKKRPQNVYCSTISKRIMLNHYIIAILLVISMYDFFFFLLPLPTCMQATSIIILLNYYILFSN